MPAHGEGTAGERYDPDLFYEVVVRPRRGDPHALPDDLHLRYQLPERPAADWLPGHLERVVADWQARVEPTREGEVYTALLTAHATLVADPGVDLTSPDWWLRQRRQAPDAEPPPPVARPVVEPPVPVGEAGRVVPPATAGRSVPSTSRPDPDPVVDLPANLTVRRCAVGAELAWVWPSWGTEAVVEWPTNAPIGIERGCAHVTRHEYGRTGCWRSAVRDEETEFQVTVRGIGRTAPPLAVTLASRPADVHYAVFRLWWRLGTPAYRVVVTVPRPPLQWCELVIGWSTSRYLPEPEEVVELASQPVMMGQTVRTVRLPRGSGARWVRCFLREGDGVRLHEPDRELLMVRPWPR